MRQIILDTETTGININDGNRILEIGCVEMVNRKLTGKTYHQYINPQRESEEGALKVHGIETTFLQTQPLFSEIVDDFMLFVGDAQLVIHNAPFDIGFLNHELKLDGNRYPAFDVNASLDTLKVAKEQRPGQRNSLDALCKHYAIDNSHRVLHGALLDAEILADVYLFLTGGQTGLALSPDSDQDGDAEATRTAAAFSLSVIKANESELKAHDDYKELLNKKAENGSLW